METNIADTLMGIFGYTRVNKGECMNETCCAESLDIDELIQERDAIAADCEVLASINEEYKVQIDKLRGYINKMHIHLDRKIEEIEDVRDDCETYSDQLDEALNLLDKQIIISGNVVNWFLDNGYTEDERPQCGIDMAKHGIEMVCFMSEFDPDYDDPHDDDDEDDEDEE